MFGLLGPNGAGKTTTLRMLSTMLKPTEGTAAIAGHDVQRAPQAVRANIGVIPTEPGLYGRLTAVENLRFYGRMYGVRGDALERRIDAALRSYANRTDLWPNLPTPPDADWTPGGQR